MKKIGVWIIIVCSGISACTDEGQETVAPEKTVLPTRLFLGSDVTIKQSQVLFFYNGEGQDTLVHRMEIDGPHGEYQERVFQAPAGNYAVITIGNGEAGHIRVGETRTVDSTLVEYADGTQPPDLYFARNYLQAGEAKRITMGMIILTTRIALTVRNVPEGVNRIRVELRNTAAGVYLNLVVQPKATVPCIAAELTGVVPGSSPVVHLKSFPSYPRADSTYLNVVCYGKQEEILYQGKSAFFQIFGSEDIKMFCTFGTGAGTTARKGLVFSLTEK